MESIEDIMHQSIQAGLRDELLSKVSLARIHNPHRVLEETYNTIYKELMNLNKDFQNPIPNLYDKFRKP